MTKVLHPSIPDYIKALPPDANLKSEEVAKCLGYASAASMWSAIALGRLPQVKKAMEIRNGFIQFENGAHNRHAFWRVKDIKRIVRELTATTV